MSPVWRRILSRVWAGILILFGTGALPGAQNWLVHILAGAALLYGVDLMIRVRRPRGHGCCDETCTTEAHP